MIDLQSTEPATPEVRRRPWIPLLVAILLLGIGLGAGIAIASRGNDKSAPAASSAAPSAIATAAQLANVDRACTNWMMGTRPASTGTTTWCTDMTAWMNRQITSGSMVGQMMWGDPDRMLAVCRTWATANPSSPSTWCDDMVTWMRQHVNGNWNGSMMNGWMMGG
ncbi:MAG: hypothetical protein ACXVLM_20435 [Ilumatobacteraceae bacterium]